MNLMKLFNKNYLIQNLKKSKVVLSIFTCLIPILNTIILIMMLTNNKNYILSFAEISIINFIGIYILPIIISICLFNYVYKKKSVDFINSMPISRKSIFVTNTVLGIMIFLLMLVINIILILVVTSIFNTIVPFKMLLDYFWFFALVYIFTFATTNLAMTVSGNAITQIVLTLLLFFLTPFIDIYVKSLYNENTNNIYLECKSDECMPKTYYCYEDVECNINKDLNKYQISLHEVKENKYTTPFALLYGGLFDESRIINKISVIKMFLLTIIYMILGYILFIKRKMEVSETSFKNIHIHNLVKSLTIIPMISLVYFAFKEEELVFTIFIITLILIYYFIYDLITKKSITRIRLSLLYFTLTLVIITTVFSIIDTNTEEDTVIKYNDIKQIALDIKNNSNRYNNKLYINNKELLSLITKEMLNEKDYNDAVDYITVYFKLNNNKEYRTTISISNTTYNKIINILSNEKDYINYYKNINLDDVYAVKIGSKVYSKKDASEYLELINNSLKKLSLKDFLELEIKYNNVGDDSSITLYTYKFNDKEEFTISGYINYDLLNTIVNSNNSLLKEKIKTIISDDYYIYYVNSYLNNNYEIDYFVLKNAKNEIYDFILKDINNIVDMRKEFITLELNIDENIYQFTTNNTDEFIKILSKKYDEIKDTEEYKSYKDPYTKESVEYYD